MHSFVFQCAETGGGYTISTVTRGLGVRHFSAKALISCMGCRERSRAGVRIPGTRPAGVYSAGLAQQMINMDGQLPGKNVVILGSGDIGLIMARRCTLEGARVLGVYELLPRCSVLQRNVEQCLTDFGIPLHLSTTVVNIIGEPRITAVDLAPVDPVTLQPDLTKTTRLECDCLLLSVGLIPQAKVAVTLGGKVNPKTRLIEVDSFKRVSGRFFTAGNCLQVHDLADDAAEEGHDAGRAAALLLETSVAPGTLVVQTDENVLFSVPQFLIKELDSQSISIRVNKILGRCKVVARCGQEIVGETEVAHAVPAEMVHVRIKKVTVMYLSQLKSQKKWRLINLKDRSRVLYVLMGAICLQNSGMPMISKRLQAINANPALATLDKKLLSRLEHFLHLLQQRMARRLDFLQSFPSLSLEINLQRQLRKQGNALQRPPL
ncbi:Glycerol-3-phosphate dehydrogenase [Spironucleus salmonicida]|uniref:Glycerol-3-phosphate dehydrogenase n=1 Tax=Spironucleus salmonicida TaxID=348837 RepID=V6LVD4_9EUKA|nr:Glycerol-3-phosphate dehydrogenase [Spironucleus salmonicida]|eukprot:EST44759.1 Glycerol-3-phosphate dehydrogenase [Spironucleus salmonicida]